MTTKPRRIFSSSKSRRFYMAMSNKKRKRKEVRSKDEEEVKRKDEEIQPEKSFFDLHLQHIVSEEDERKYKGMMHSLNGPKFSSTVVEDDGSKCRWIATKDFNNSRNHSSLKANLSDHWKGVPKEYGGFDSSAIEQHHFFSHCSAYQDILYANKAPFYLEGSKEDVNIMGAYIVHALNHVFRTKDCIRKNDDEMASLGADVGSRRFQDQGFTRPKVLILLPLASIMYRVVMNLIQLTPLAKVDKKDLKLFSDKYGGEELKGSKEKGQKPENEDLKPKHFQSLVEGNNDEKFIVGIEFTGTTIKFSSDLSSSDFIIASPRRLVDEIKRENVDILSSIEILIIDHADIIAMQDWSHVRTVIQKLNQLPSKLPEKNMRIRPWYLTGHAKFYRQTMILGYYSNTDILGSFLGCSNHEGKMRRLMSEYEGVNQWFSKLEQTNVIGNYDLLQSPSKKKNDLPQWFCRTIQVFVRFTEGLQNDDDARFDYFAKKVFPRIKNSAQGGFMIFTSSHSEFIRIRDFLWSEETSVYLLGEEDVDQMDISSARLQFSERKIKIMLYTERSHFYNRYKIDGVNYLIMYSLPERKEFYFEILEMLAESENKACTALYSPSDKYRLQGIVGTELATFMLISKETISEFTK